jgi:cytochrome c-type biogenesis protein CcmH/NrfG
MGYFQTGGYTRYRLPQNTSKPAKNKRHKKLKKQTTRTEQDKNQHPTTSKGEGQEHPNNPVT